MRTFVLNLEHNTERKKYMQDLLKDIPIDYEFFPAVYGKSITNIDQFYDSKLAEKRAKRQLNVGEIGTAISHKNIYKKMIDENIEQALILEDDVTFLDGFIDVYKKIEKINVGNKIILLGTIVKKKIKKIWKKILTPEHSMYLVLNNYAGAYGYIIGLDAAKRIYYHNKKVFIEADKWKYYRRLSQIWLVSPSVITVDEIFPSEIGDELRH
ncbi:glycosyltransferase family 25 protein [Treponema putidum]|uniref:Glycosyltransferase family 25 protein n=1 Tax=Treponema putidum TaxID=221027 RepID=A0AAE9SHM6_9SPIR|nr:glycosyltransferase family 25 protein [Treponema putidum]UTY28323.1 glycosyltransferase family 25 protein [Treponema putidum]UTY30803.1 glycosyltransferase family 25 protein [Treponema putidum]UTY33225.1 glycosyltransferase family 25 protein [Treponema putidum]